MSSQQSSSTQQSDLPSSHHNTSHKNSPESFISYRDRSGSQIFDEIQQLRSQNIYYAAEKDLSSLCEFIFNKDLKGES